MCLCTGDIYAIRGALDDMEEQVGIGLLGGSQAAVALDVSHCAVDSQIFVLYAGQELHEILMVMGTAGLIDFISRGINRIHSIHANTALEASSRLLAEQTLHLDLLNQVVGGLMHMGETVDLLAGEVRCRSHEVFILRVLCKLIGCGKGVQRGADYRIVYRVFNLLAEHPEVQIQLTQGFNVLVLRHHGRNSILSFK